MFVKVYLVYLNVCESTCISCILECFWKVYLVYWNVCESISCIIGILQKYILYMGMFVKEYLVYNIGLFLKQYLVYIGKLLKEYLVYWNVCESIFCILVCSGKYILYIGRFQKYIWYIGLFLEVYLVYWIVS